MTIPMDASINFTLGHVFAVAGSEAILEDPEKERACLRRGRLFTALVAAPVGVYFLVRWPDWAWMYIARERSRSPALAALGFGCYIVAHELGFRNAARLIKAGKTDKAAIQGLASLSLLALIAAFGWERFRWQGTTAEFEAGNAVDVFKSRDFHASMVVAGIIAITFAVLVIVRNLSS